MSIILFSRPVHSGKTTELLHWCNRQKNIEGILMPDMNGSRKILNLKTKEVFDIECTSVEASLEPLTSVGKFHFYTSAFEKANAMLIGTLEHDPRCLVIDEAGKLELEGKGFYPAIAKAVSVYDNEAKTGNLLVAVREGLCSNVIAFFGINRCRIIHGLEELTG